MNKDQFNTVYKVIQEINYYLHEFNHEEMSFAPLNPNILPGINLPYITDVVVNGEPIVTLIPTLLKRLQNLDNYDIHRLQMVYKELGISFYYLKIISSDQYEYLNGDTFEHVQINNENIHNSAILIKTTSKNVEDLRNSNGQTEIAMVVYHF